MRGKRRGCGAARGPIANATRRPDELLEALADVIRVQRAPIAVAE